MSLVTRITALAVEIAGSINSINAAFSGITPNLFSTGDLKFAMRSTPETGWVVATGTIGNASSGATTRANADCLALFTLLWTDFANSEAPVSSGRGASAVADFNANKTITIPDCRGRMLCAMDDLGGSAASRVTVAGSGVNGTTRGLGGGDEEITLTSGQSGVPAHTHPYVDRYRDTVANRQAGSANTNAGALTSVNVTTSANTAANAASSHSNMPPVLMLPLFIKL